MVPLNCPFKMSSFICFSISNTNFSYFKWMIFLGLSMNPFEILFNACKSFLYMIKSTGPSFPEPILTLGFLYIIFFLIVSIFYFSFFYIFSASFVFYFIVIIPSNLLFLFFFIVFDISSLFLIS